MRLMFFNAASFDRDLSSWDVGSHTAPLGTQPMFGSFQTSMSFRHDTQCDPFYTGLEPCLAPRLPCSALATPEPTPSPTPPSNYCLEGYADYGVRYNWGLGKITVAFTHEMCSARCSLYAHPRFNGGCKSYLTGMYFGMLFCRSYGGNQRTTRCASWAKPDSRGVGSGVLGSMHPRTNQENIGGNCCSNSTFVLADMARLAK